MKDYFVIIEDKDNINYFNEKNKRHKLIGPAIESKSSFGEEFYFINGVSYMTYMSDDNLGILIDPLIIRLLPKYELYIKQNVKNLIKKYNTIVTINGFIKEEINELPDWLKDLVIL